MKRKNKMIIRTILVWIILLIFLFPIYWIVSSSFKPPIQIHSMPPKFIFKPTFEGYKNVLSRTQIPKCMLNSLIVCAFSVGIALVVGTMLAFALSRFEFKGKKDISFWIVSLRMAPPVVSIIPFFVIIQSLGLYDTKTALVFIYLTFNIPFVVWMVRGYMSQVPVSLDEAAYIEGCSKFMVLTKVIIPVIRTGVVSTAIMSFIFSWNEFFFAFLLTGNDAKTVPVAIQGFLTMTGTRWDELTAAGTLVAIPALILSLLSGKYFIQGLLEGALKG